MAKKYLLYIHDERFEKEPHKSQLINGLLAQHYDPRNTPAKKQKPIVEKTKDVDKINHEVAVAAFNGEETCQGHAMRMNCGLPGCKY